MAEKKSKKTAVKEPKKQAAPPASRGKGCLAAFIVFDIAVCILVFGGFLLVRAYPTGIAFLDPVLEKCQKSAGAVLPSAGSAEVPAPAKKELVPPAIPSSKPADYALGVKLIREAEGNFLAKHYEKARNDARIALQKFPFSDPHWHAAAELVTKSSFAILRSSGDNALEKKRVISRKGETLRSLGTKFALTPDSIRQGNPALQKISSQDAPIPAGTTLHIYCGKWRLQISNARKRLFVMDGGKLFAVYPVGIADEFAKAEMGCVSPVTAKIANPPWKDGRDLYAPGHPMNILGAYSMEFRDRTGRSVFRIHGTNRKENVGRTIKGPGCVSMKNENMKELFHLIPTGTMVEVIR